MQASYYANYKIVPSESILQWIISQLKHLSVFQREDEDGKINVRKRRGWCEDIRNEKRYLMYKIT